MDTAFLARIAADVGVVGLIAVALFLFRQPIADLLKARAAEAKAAAEFYPVAARFVEAWEAHRALVEQHGADMVRYLRRLNSNGADDDADAARH